MYFSTLHSVVVDGFQANDSGMCYCEAEELRGMPFTHHRMKC